MKLLFLLLFTVSTSFSFSQNISEDIGGVSCTFSIVSDGIDLEVKKQLMIMRAERRTEVSSLDNSSYGLGLGYSEWHLEFTAEKEITYRKKESDENIAHRGKYCIQLIDSDKTILIKTYVTADCLKQWNGGTKEDPIFTYSLDLLDLPLLLMDDVAFFDIVMVN